MQGVLFRYLSKMLIQRTAATLLVLIGLLQLVDLFEATSDIFERGLGFAGVVKYALLRTPMMAQQILPISMLIAALTCFTGLARNSEMSALRATGTNIYRVVRLLLPAAALVAVFHFIVADQIAPRSQQAFTTWWNSHPPIRKIEDPTQPAPPAKSKTVWFRTDAFLVYAEAAQPDGKRLQGVRIYRRDEAGRFSQRLVAKAAVYGPDGRWRLEGVDALDVGPFDLTEGADGARVWNTRLAPDDVIAVFWPEDRISSARALHALTGDRPADKSPAFYATRLNRALAEPLGVLVMLLLAAPAALAHQRHNSAGLLMFSLGAGLLYLMVDGVLTALGQTNVLPPLLAAWAAPTLFAALAAAAMVHLEG